MALEREGQPEKPRLLKEIALVPLIVTFLCTANKVGLHQLVHFYE